MPSGRTHDGIDRVEDAVRQRLRRGPARRIIVKKHVRAAGKLVRRDQRRAVDPKLRDVACAVERGAPLERCAARSKTKTVNRTLIVSDGDILTVPLYPAGKAD